MWEIIIKAGSLVFIIFLGFVLRRMQLLQKEDCRTLMMLIMNVTPVSYTHLTLPTTSRV